jgi:hypothetical protein
MFLENDGKGGESDGVMWGKEVVGFKGIPAQALNLKPKGGQL